MLPCRALSQACFKCSESACSAQHLRHTHTHTYYAVSAAPVQTGTSSECSSRHVRSSSVSELVSSCLLDKTSARLFQEMIFHATYSFTPLAGSSELRAADRKSVFRGGLTGDEGECAAVLLLNGEQLEAEAAVHVLLNFDSTQTEILKQNQVLLLQQGHRRHYIQMMQ